MGIGATSLPLIQPVPKVDICDVTNEPMLINVRCLQSNSSLKVSCQVDQSPVVAVVDTAADVTIISEVTLKGMVTKPKVLREVRMRAAGENQIFRAQDVGPVLLKIGENSLSRNIFVAPIRDPMLLGIDVLRELNAKIDVSGAELICNNQSIPLASSHTVRRARRIREIKLVLREKKDPKKF